MILIGPSVSTASRPTLHFRLIFILHLNLVWTRSTEVGGSYVRKGTFVRPRDRVHRGAEARGSDGHGENLDTAKNLVTPNSAVHGIDLTRWRTRSTDAHVLHSTVTGRTSSSCSWSIRIRAAKLRICSRHLTNLFLRIFKYLYFYVYRKNLISAVLSIDL